LKNSCREFTQKTSSMWYYNNVKYSASWSAASAKRFPPDGAHGSYSHKVPTVQTHCEVNVNVSPFGACNRTKLERERCRRENCVIQSAQERTAEGKDSHWPGTEIEAFEQFSSTGTYALQTGLASRTLRAVSLLTAPTITYLRREPTKGKFFSWVAVTFVTYASFCATYRMRFG
jgi:hypothetical protein